MAPTDLKVKLIELALNGKLSQSTIKELATETGYCPQYVRQCLRDCVKSGYLERFTVNPKGREFLEQENTRNE